MKDFCKYCFNDPVIHNCQKELCGVCEMETEVAKKKPVVPDCNNCIKESYCPMRTGGMSCTGFQQKPETNADRIRAMTDEELAKFFADNLCELFCNGGVSSCNADCYIHALKWLRQEVAE